jgi:hypothetical protein
VWEPEAASKLGVEPLEGSAPFAASEAPAAPDPSRWVMRLGRALHAAGSPSHRVEEGMELAARRLGIRGQYFSTPTALFASFGSGDDHRTYLERVEPADEVARNRLGRGQSIDAPAAEFEVLRVHAAGEIDCKHQVAAGYRHFELVANTLRPGRCDNQQDPRQDRKPESPVKKLFDFRSFIQHRETAETRHFQSCLAILHCRWQELAHQPRQRQRQ